ncbi:MAG: hypothetical protein M3370_01555 [Actinomycetota bacterium]|nr:hypothetical protein [Actinomycetota bacterium]
MSAPATSSELPPVHVEQLDSLLGEALAECARSRHAAEVERVAATVILPFDDPSVPEEAAGMLTAALERRGDVQAARLLAGIGVIARARLRRLSVAAGERLRKQGVVAKGVRSLGALEVEEARLLVDGPAEILLVVLRRSGQRRIQTALVGTAEHEGDQVVVKAQLGAPERDTGLAGALPGGQVRPIGRSELLDRLHQAAAGAAAHGCPVDVESPFCLAVLGRALAGEPDVFAHLEVTAAHPLDVDPEEDPEGYEALLDTLVHDFGEHVRERHGVEGAIWRHGEFASCALLEWKAGYVDGRLGNWTVADVREFLIEYAPRKLTMEPETAGALPACVAEVLSFLDDARGLTGDPLTKLRTACETLAPQFERANADRSNWGLAKAMATQMLSEGVDPGDETAVQRWIEEFNDRPRAVRDRVIAGARPELRVHIGGEGSPPARRAPGSTGQRRTKRRSASAARKRNRRG